MDILPRLTRSHGNLVGALALIGLVLANGYGMVSLWENIGGHSAMHSVYVSFEYQLWASLRPSFHWHVAGVISAFMGLGFGFSYALDRDRAFLVLAILWGMISAGCLNVGIISAGMARLILGVA